MPATRRAPDLHGIHPGPADHPAGPLPNRCAARMDAGRRTDGTDQRPGSTAEMRATSSAVLTGSTITSCAARPASRETGLPGAADP